MIELNGVYKTYPMGTVEVPALQDVSLTIHEGEFVAIMGQSGSGKSTLLHLLGLLDVPDRGSMKLFGRDVGALSDDELARLRSESIGFIFQQFHLLPRTSATENVSLPLIYHRTDAVCDEPEALLQRVGLGDRMGHAPNELSGGQQQRVAIARSLVNRPRLLLADEPTGNLDSKSGQEIIALIHDLNRSGITVVMVTHEPTIAAHARRIIKIQDGRIVSDESRGDAGTPTAEGTAAGIRRTERPSWAARCRRFLGEFHSHIQQANRALAANKMRTALSTLGIVIGVASLVAMIALGAGAQRSVKKELAGLGANRLIVRPNYMMMGQVRLQGGIVSRLTPWHVDDLRESVPSVKYVSPFVRGRVQAVWGNRNVSTELRGSTPEYVNIYSAEPVEGRFFTEQEITDRARVALVGMTVIRDLFNSNNPIGETIRINRVIFQVIGILPQKGMAGPQDQDDVIVAPVSTAMYRVLGRSYYDALDVSAMDEETVDKTMDEVLEETRRWPKIANMQGDCYRVDNLASVQAAFSAIAKTISFLLAAIAGVSMFVGGVGIMNIMLVSVTERTREIGLRKALGARRRDILGQFLVESVSVCLIGGTVGIALGWIIILSVAKISGWVLAVSPGAVLLGLVFSTAVGLVFGLLPANRAAGLNPITALRSE